MSFENWEDSGINWTDPRIAPMWNALESIRLALVERASVAGYTLPEILQSEVVRGAFIYYYTSAIQTAVSALIPLFVNHLDSNGDWTGKTSIPAWTEAAILAAIGAASRITAPRLAVTADWIAQQYAIINMLRWNSKNELKINYWTKSITPIYNTIWKELRDSAINSYNNAEWVIATWGSYYNSYFNIHCEVLSCAPSSIFYFGRSKSNIIPFNKLENIDYIIDVDLYSLMRSFANFNESEYDEIKTGVPYGTYKKIDTQEINLQAQGNTPWFEVGFNDESLPYDIPETPVSGYFGIGWEATSAVANSPELILKYDGPNGFKFKNW